MNILLVLFIIGFIFYIVNCAVLIETLIKALKKGYCEKRRRKVSIATGTLMFSAFFTILMLGLIVVNVL